MKIAFSGHRPDKLGGFQPDNPVEQKLRIIITMYLECKKASEPDITVISGMALGVDQWAAHAAVSLGLPFIAAVPFEGQEKKWPTFTQVAYRELLRKAQEVHVVSPGGYANWKFQKRNEWMVDECDVLAAVWNGTPGGTSNCVAYATKKNRIVDRLEW